MTTWKILAIIMATAMLWGADAALAQNPASPVPTAAQTEAEEAAGGEGTAVLEEIEVRSAVRREELKSTSATVLTNEDIVGRIYAQPLDILYQSPGVSITQYGENGVTPMLRMRGFTGAHGSGWGGGGLGMFFDGIPLQDRGANDDYMDTSIIIPLEIESVEIIKGPGSIFYGPGAAVGAVAFHTYKTGDFTKFNMRYGSYNEIDAQSVIARTQGDLSSVYAFQAFHTDGWQDNSDWDRYNVSGRWSYQFTDQFSASLNLRANKSEWNSSGYIPGRLNLPDTAWVDDGSGKGNGQGGDRRRFDGRLWANYLLNDESQITVYAFGTDLTYSRWLRGFPASYPTPPTNPIGNDNSVFDTSLRAYGLGTAYNFKGEIADREANITVGLDYLRENATRDQFDLIWGQGRTKGPQFVQWDYVLTTSSLLGSASYQILEPLQLRLGARYDHFGGHVNSGPGNNRAASNNLGPNQYYKAPSKSAVSPRTGLLLTPLAWLDVYTNYGRAYRLPGLVNGNFFTGTVGSGANARQVELVEHDQFELGYRMRPAEWLDLEMAYYYVKTNNDEINVLDGTAWITTYAGKTERSGLETSFKIRPYEFWSLSGHYTYQDAKYKNRVSGNTAANAMDYSGLRLPFVPRHITNLELAYAPDEGLGGRASFRWEADSMYVDDPAVRINGTANTNHTIKKAAQDRGALDLQLNYKFNDEYKLTFDVLNVTDRRNLGHVSGLNATTGDYSYNIQPGRTFYVGMEINWK